MKRITMVVGHFGSGKTEISMNLVMDMKEKYKKTAIIDLDIANPYFRSRESQQFLENNGVETFFNSYGYDITEDLPAIAATIRKPLENEDYMVVADVGGNDSGAMILNQFSRYFNEDNSQMLCVLNANRPDTETPELMIESMKSLEQITGLKIKGIINNTHLLRETTVEDIVGGYRKCLAVSEKTGCPIVFNTCVRDLADELQNILAIEGIGKEFVIYPIDLYMRPVWLDKAVY